MSQNLPNLTRKKSVIWKVYLGGCTITSKTKINVFWKNFFATLILAFEANGALSIENETKIVKITHSAQAIQKERCICLVF